MLDGPMNGTVFLVWVERMPAPELRPGDLVSMDHPAAHKVEGIERAIEARGAELRYLPPYSPDLNPSGATRLIRSRRDRRSQAAEASRPSPSSRRCCARPPRAPSMVCGPPSADCSTCSRPPSAPTTSLTPVMDAQREHAPSERSLVEADRGRDAIDEVATAAGPTHAAALLLPFYD